MRRTGIALTALATLAIAFATSGSGALAIDAGPLQAQPDPISFNTEADGVTTPVTTVTFQNQTANPVTINNNGVTTDNNDYNVVNDNCSGVSLDPLGGANDSCTVGVTFTPSSPGADPGNLVISDDDASNATQHVGMGGQGVANQFSLTTPADFGPWQVGTTSSPNETATLSNNTDYPANPSNPNIVGGNAGDFNIANTDCNSTVAAQPGACTINLNFSPNAVGSRSSNLNAGGQSVGLSGTGTDPNASVSPTSIPFGNQPVATTSGPSTITLTNNGTAPLSYNGFAQGGANPVDFLVNDGGCNGVQSVAPGNSCTITVEFVPVTTGNLSSTVIVHDNDPQNPTQTVTVSGNGTPSSVGFAPGSVIFTRPVTAGTGSPVHTITISNTTNSNLPITSISIAGTNPKNFIHSADHCSGTNLSPSSTCTVDVQFTPSAAGQRTALLQVTDTGPDAPHTHDLGLTGTGLFPHDPKSIHGSVGCSSAKITWVSPTATRFAGVQVVRNHAHFPTSPADGTTIAHAGVGLAVDKNLKHFKTYYYRVFARYHSLTHAGGINYSAGVHFKEHTGEICTPQNGARLRGLMPTFTWLPSPSQAGYSFVLQHAGDNINLGYTHRTSWRTPSSWHYLHQVHRLRRGNTYTFFLFTYPKSHPDGFLVGQVTFTER